MLVVLDKESSRRKYIKENNLKQNLTTWFLLPLFGYINDFYPSEFISAYIIDEENPKVVFCFNNSDSKLLNSVITTLQEDININNVSYDDNNKEIVVIMNLPKQFHIDYNLFKVGKWSKFSNKAKELLLDNYGRRTGNGKSIQMIDCLFPDNKAREFWANKLGCKISDLPNEEVFDSPTMEKEIYKNINKLLEINGYK